MLLIKENIHLSSIDRREFVVILIHCCSSYWGFISAKKANQSPACQNKRSSIKNKPKLSLKSHKNTVLVLPKVMQKYLPLCQIDLCQQLLFPSEVVLSLIFQCEKRLRYVLINNGADCLPCCYLKLYAIQTSWSNSVIRRCWWTLIDKVTNVEKWSCCRLLLSKVWSALFIVSFWKYVSFQTTLYSKCKISKRLRVHRNHVIDFSSI